MDGLPLICGHGIADLNTAQQVCAILPTVCYTLSGSSRQVTTGQQTKETNSSHNFPCTLYKEVPKSTLRENEFPSERKKRDLPPAQLVHDPGLDSPQGPSKEKGIFPFKKNPPYQSLKNVLGSPLPPLLPTLLKRKRGHVLKGHRKGCGSATSVPWSVRPIWGWNIRSQPSAYTGACLFFFKRMEPAI